MRCNSQEALRERDQWGFVAELEPQARVEWSRRLRWVKLVERLGRAGRLGDDDRCVARHLLVPRDPAAHGVSWCEAWERYVVAVNRYGRPKRVVPDLPAHAEMLQELGGNVLCLSPGVDWFLRRPLAHFGALDLFFSHLRDLGRDADAGRCNLPLHLLSRFGLAPQDIVDGSCLDQPGYVELMRYWLDHYLPQLRAEAAEFTGMRDLPAPLARLRDASTRRHARVERVFRAARYDFRLAEAAYFAELEQPTAAA